MNMNYKDLPDFCNQDVVLNLAVILKNISKTKERCLPRIAPFDLKLVVDKQTSVVQPDIMLFCDGDLPCAVFEVLSPSTAIKDKGVKKELYLSYVESRFYKGKRSHLLKSRFIAETGLGKGALKLKTNSNYKKGDLVKHKIFGIGRVMSVGKVKKDYKLTINFGGNIKDIISTFVEKI